MVEMHKQQSEAGLTPFYVGSAGEQQAVSKKGIARISLLVPSIGCARRKFGIAGGRCGLYHGFLPSGALRQQA
jgi:hypothetical protein